MIPFEDIYNTYGPQIYRVCLGYTNDPAQAQDLVQDTFISVWKALPAFRQQAKLGTWIFRIATNHCLRAMEVSKRMPKSELPFDLVQTVEVSQETQLAFLYQCIAELDETDRIIISLELEGLPQAEIAAVVGLSHSNVRIKVHRIKEKLSKKFKDHGQFE